MAEKVYCPECGHDDIDSNYNYDYANMEYECRYCGETFTDNEIVHCEICGEQILFGDIYHNDEGDAICEDCFKKVYDK